MWSRWRSLHQRLRLPPELDPLLGARVARVDLPRLPNRDLLPNDTLRACDNM